MTPFKPQTAFKTTNRAKRTPLKVGLIGVFVLIGLFYVNEAVSGATILEDDFESYNYGSLDGVNNWDTPNDYWQVVNDPYLGSKSAQATSGTAYLRKQGNNTEIGTSSFWFKRDSIDGFHFYLGYYSAGWFPITHLRGGAIDPNTIYYYGPGPTYYSLWTNVSTSTWHLIQVGWDCSNDADNKVKFKLDGGDWSNWLDPAYNRPYANKIEFFNYNEYKYTIDEIQEIGDNCSFFSSSSGCEKANCCWYWSAWLWQNFCVKCPAGECSEGPYDCQNCITEETCEAFDYCYWYEGSCKYGTGQCGEGLELQFCENQTDCENAGGYWYDDFCWLSSKTTLIDWEDYYDEHGDYATPSAWISGVASSTGNFFSKIGGFLTTFQGNFDLKEAYERGKNFGLAIPYARGYMEIFNDFLGDWPISELFIFILVFMLAIGVFRIVRNLIQLLKFW